MTIIAAVHDPEEGVTFIGSDTLVSAAVPLSCKKKWVKAGPWAVGVTGYWRTFQVVKLGKDQIKECADAMAVAFTLRGLLEADGCTRINDPGPVNFDQRFILASAKGVWDIDVIFSPSRVDPGKVWAGGSGGEFAFGAAHALEDTMTNKRWVLEKSIEAAIALDLNCGGEIYLDELR